MGPQPSKINSEEPKTPPTKKLVNDPSKCVIDSLKGFVMSNSRVKLLEGHTVVVRSDIQKVKNEGKVVIVTGGGSGHEPTHAGYVGGGMLSAAVCGDVFASPSSTSILDTIRTCASDAGVLLLVKNYTGDRLNFGKAAELAKSENINVQMVVVGEDCALTSKDKSAGRRGLCGTLFCHKIAGAMAEEGKSLEEIVSVLNSVVKEMGTISISLSPCSIPGKAPSFSIDHDKIEFGLGIHGEAGVTSMKISDVSSIVQHMIDHVRNSGYLPEIEGHEVALFVNNLGGTSNLELSIVAKEALSYLDSVNVNVTRCYVGAFITSLEMAGVSLTIMILNKERLEYLDYPVDVPAWPKGGEINGIGDIIQPCVRARLPSVVDLDYPEAQGIGITIFECTKRACTALIDSEDLLNELDRASGDGDTGTTIGRGAKDLFLGLSDIAHPNFNVNNPHHFMIQIAQKIEESMGGSSGALISLLFSAAAVPLKDASDVKAFAAALKQGIGCMKKYGGADEGDRTMLDALCPALSALEEVLEKKETSFAKIMTAMAKAAREGADSTAKMTARAGRASYVSDMRLTHPDPGAVVVALAFEAMSKVGEQR